MKDRNLGLRVTQNLTVRFSDVLLVASQQLEPWFDFDLTPVKLEVRKMALKDGNR